MSRNNIPKFTIKRTMQKSKSTGVYFDMLITDSIMKQISIEITGKSNYEVSFVENEYSDEFLDATYNKGRLAILQYHNIAAYISFSDENCEGRNSGIQSVPIAFYKYYTNPHKYKELFFYFLPCKGNNATPYYLFMYRLMKTAGFNFINTPPSLEGQITPFTSIEDIIRARKENATKKPSNNPTYIIKDAPNNYQIFGKTYGANKYDTSLICYAISKLAKPNDCITLYEYNEQDLKELPASSLNVIRSMGKINIVNINDELECQELDENNSLRSPRFNAHLLYRLGERHCVLCNCKISEIIQAAHIWPVANIKKVPNLTNEEKLNYATDAENGLWLCQNHHKLFDSNILILSSNGQVSYKQNLSDEDISYLNSITTTTVLPDALITDNYIKYINKRYNL